jgi:hypothetical protein
MIRNLLYAICLHFLFFFFIFFVNGIDKDNIARNFEALEIENNFLEKNNIMPTGDNTYSKLSLQEKINLYRLSKEYYDINNRIDNPQKIESNIENEMTKDVLYVGPTDYKKLMNKKNINEKSVLNDKNVVDIDEIKKNAIDMRDEISKIFKKNNIKSKEEIGVTVDINKIFTKKDIDKIKNIISFNNDEYYLTPKEKLNIQKQLVNCYKDAITQTERSSKVPILITIKLFRDGSINTKEIKAKILDRKNIFSKNDYNTSIENVKVALAFCNPIVDLPILKYHEWKNINFTFEAL